jgi:hypothetical protein
MPVLRARDPLERYLCEGVPQRGRFARERTQPLMPDLPSAGQLFDNQLGVHSHDDRRRTELGCSLQPGKEAAILRDVVGIDADGVLALGEYGTRGRVAHDGAVASRPGIPT